MPGVSVERKWCHGDVLYKLSNYPVMYFNFLLEVCKNLSHSLVLRVSIIS